MDTFSGPLELIPIKDFGLHLLIESTLADFQDDEMLKYNYGLAHGKRMNLSNGC